MPQTPARSPPIVPAAASASVWTAATPAPAPSISPYYDSLLVKVTSWDNTFEGVCRKAMRAINEVHIRGVKTNIPFVTNILHHPTFIAGQVPHEIHRRHARSCLRLTNSRDRATRVLKYIANIQVAAPNAERKQYDTPRFPQPKRETPREGLKQMLDQKGPDAVKRWVLDQKKLLITDTTMRDAHQSLLSTRMRTRDMLKGADGTADILSDCFSLEMWGGATFDVGLPFPPRRLRGSVWTCCGRRSRTFPSRCCCAAANAVGYTNYPDNLIRAFVKEAAQSGIDVFRVFDSLNWIPGMEIAMDEVLKQGKLCEATMCYTGDILDPDRDQLHARVLCQHGKGAGEARRSPAGYQGYVRPAEALRRQEAYLHPEAGGGPAHPPAHPRHHRATRSPPC